MPQTLSFHGIGWQLYLTKRGPVTQGKRFKLIHLLFIKQNLFICLAPKQCRIYCKDECHTLLCVRKNSLGNTSIIFLSLGIWYTLAASNPRKKSKPNCFISRHYKANANECRVASVTKSRTVLFDRNDNQWGLIYHDLGVGEIVGVVGRWSGETR